jgi:Raf kinase inhibitor-like YbhB/YbcL family protein
MLTPMGSGGALLPAFLVFLGGVLSSCGKEGTSIADAAQNRGVRDPLVTTPVPASTLRISSPAFGSNGDIPKKYTCQGDDLSPTLNISGIPTGTKSLVLVVDDPDAPDPAAPKRDWIHWIVFDLPPTVTQLNEGITALPPPARGGLNDWDKPTYGGPCPPKGRHRYFFRIYALDRMVGLNRPNLAELRAAVSGHVLGVASLIGTYAKS